MAFDLQELPVETLFDIEAPTYIGAYVRTGNAALITEGMVKGTPHKRLLELRPQCYEEQGPAIFDLSDLSHYGFYALHEGGKVIVGFQGYSNEFLDLEPDIKRPLRPWHVAIPERLTI